MEKSHKQREINRYARKKSRNELVAIIGYTNAGKTTLFNKLTESVVATEKYPNKKELLDNQYSKGKENKD